MSAHRPSWAGAVMFPVLILFMALIATACAKAPVAWDKPGASLEDWNRDQWDCRAKARREVDKRIRQQGPDFRSSGFGDDTTLGRQMARHDARRDERRMFEQCLKLRGYSKK